MREILLRNVALRLWAMLYGGEPNPSRVSSTEVRTFEKIVSRMAEDPDFQALASATARQMSVGEAAVRERKARGPLL
jgi:hypothetical protein